MMCLAGAGGDARQFWEDMIDIGRHDILRALLITGTPEQLRELTKRQSDVGRWQAKLCKDPGLSAVLKEFPYQSNKRIPQNFNGKATFTNTEEEILCRHLATYQQEEQARDPRIKFSYDKFRSAKEIKSNVKPDIEKTYEALKAQASEAHLINNDEGFGQFLAGQFAAMEKENQPARLMLVESTNHTMNLGLRIKPKEGKPSYVVKFFDPNVTTTGTRSKAGNVQTLEMQAIAPYITDEESLRAYYPEARGLSMIYVRSEAQSQANIAISRGSSAGRTLTTCIETKDIDATAVWHLMREGFAGNLRQLHDHLNTLPEDRRIEIIVGKSPDGVPALFMSMQNGHAEAINAYRELLASMPEMPEKERIELIAAKDSAGFPALFRGMQNGHAKAINAYRELLASMPEKERIELIAAKKPDGTSALYIVMARGQSELIQAYGDLLKLVPIDKQVELLLAKNSAGRAEGKSGLHAALTMGKFETVKVLLNMLEGLAPNLSPEQRASLWQELKGYEASITQCTFPPTPLSHRQYGEMKSTFSHLMSALEGEGTLGRGT